MTFDITKRRATETAEIELKTGEGSPLLDDAGNPLSVTVHGPGSKIWQQADAERNRRRTHRIEKNRGKLTAALEGAKEDEVDFLTTITISFNGWSYPHPDKDDEGNPKTWDGAKDMFRAAYSDPTIGYIRDHVHTEANDWGVFTRGSATS